MNLRSKPESSGELECRLIIGWVFVGRNEGEDDLPRCAPGSFNYGKFCGILRNEVLLHWTSRSAVAVEDNLISWAVHGEHATFSTHSGHRPTASVIKEHASVGTWMAILESSQNSTRSVVFCLCPIESQSSWFVVRRFCPRLRYCRADHVQEFGHGV